MAQSNKSAARMHSEAAECVFNADYTISFSTLKYCHTLYPAKKYSGNIKND